MINFNDRTLGFDLFHTVLKELKNRPDHAAKLMDSLSKDQFRSKGQLLSLVNKLNLNKSCSVVIFGCWYASILIPAMYNNYKKIVGIDLDHKVIGFANSNLFRNYSNVTLISDDVFNTNIDYSEINLIVNTSCEHMQPMNTWPYWNEIKSGTYFAFQSNDMFNIEGHVNCVNSIDEFKNQLPANSIILLEDELTDDRGKRFTIIGQII